MPWATASQLLVLDAGNRHCELCVKAVKAVVKAGCGVWVENPDNSWLWRQPAMARMIPDDHFLGARLLALRLLQVWSALAKEDKGADESGPAGQCGFVLEGS